MLIKRDKKRALGRLCLLSARVTVLLLLVCVNYRVHSQQIYNHSSWIVNVRNPETGEQRSIQPDSFTTFEQGSADDLEVDTTSDKFKFKISHADVTLIEPFKGQLNVQKNGQVCDRPQDVRNDSFDCDVCSCSGE